MPNCFSLTPKREPSAPAVLAKIDEELCQRFNVPCDAKYWHADWYDIIGFRLSLGHSFSQIHIYLVECLDKYPNERGQTLHLIDINAWLDENYIANAWAEIGRR